MEIRFASAVRKIKDLYEGYDDVPGLGLTLHLHGWQFPAGVGEARFRVEVREGPNDPALRPKAVGFVRTSEEKIIDWQAASPFEQALFDGIMSQSAVAALFPKFAKEALKPPKSAVEEPPFKKFRIRLKEKNA